MNVEKRSFREFENVPSIIASLVNLNVVKIVKKEKEGEMRKDVDVIEIRFSNVLTTGEASQLSEFIIPAISRSSWEVAQRSALTVHQRCFSNVAMVWLD